MQSILQDRDGSLRADGGTEKWQRLRVQLQDAQAAPGPCAPQAHRPIRACAHHQRCILRAGMQRPQPPVAALHGSVRMKASSLNHTISTTGTLSRRRTRSPPELHCLCRIAAAAGACCSPAQYGITPPHLAPCLIQGVCFQRWRRLHIYIMLQNAAELKRHVLYSRSPTSTTIQAAWHNRCPI